MKILEHLPSEKILDFSLLTIGIFDGLHRGHQRIFQKLHQLKAKTHHPIAVITFIRKNVYIQDQKTQLHMLKKWAVDLVVLLELNKEFMDKDYKTFIEELKRALNFSHIVLGEDACFGKNRMGTPEKILSLQNDYAFTAHYLKKLVFQRKIISSSLIKEELQKANISVLKKLIGRSFSISFYLENKKQALEKQMLPPTGKYRVKIEQNNQTFNSCVQIINTENEKMLYFCSQDLLNKQERITIKF